MFLLLGMLPAFQCSPCSDCLPCTLLSHVLMFSMFIVFLLFRMHSAWRCLPCYHCLPCTLLPHVRHDFIVSHVLAVWHALCLATFAELSLCVGFCLATRVDKRHRSFAGAPAAIRQGFEVISTPLALRCDPYGWQRLSYSGPTGAALPQLVLHSPWSSGRAPSLSHEKQ